MRKLLIRIPAMMPTRLRELIKTKAKATFWAALVINILKAKIIR
jgi:hypothetical protein